MTFFFFFFFFFFLFASVKWFLTTRKTFLPKLGFFFFFFFFLGKDARKFLKNKKTVCYQYKHFFFFFFLFYLSYFIFLVTFTEISSINVTLCLITSILCCVFYYGKKILSFYWKLMIYDTFPLSKIKKKWLYRKYDLKFFLYCC